MNLGNALLLLYLLYYLKDAVDLTDKDAEAGVFRLTAAVRRAHRRHRDPRRDLVRPAGPAQGLRDRVRLRDRGRALLLLAFVHT